MKNSLSFGDTLLVPKYSDLISRGEIDLSSELSKIGTLKNPIISSPMDTVTESEMAIEMAKWGGLGVIHRYNTIENQTTLVRDVREKTDQVAVAIGVSGDFLERAHSVVLEGAKIICVDIAHGHHVLMKKALESLRSKFGESVHIMAGNVATLEGFNDLADWGADSIRVGIGGGSICSTRIQTGHGVPTLQSVLDCSRTDRDAALIADGGIKNSGDMVKALAAGADFVMLGSLLAGTDEAPGEVTYVNGLPYKSYRGMASVEAQIDWRGHSASVEGVSTSIPTKGPLGENLKLLTKGIRSGLSYSGCRNLKDFRNKAQFIKQTSSGALESSTHINS